MPDITMCFNDHCPKSGKCRRHTDSGAVPSYYQSVSFFEHKNGECEHYLEAVKQEGVDEQADP